MIVKITDPDLWKNRRHCSGNERQPYHSEWHAWWEPSPMFSSNEPGKMAEWDFCGKHAGKFLRIGKFPKIGILN